MHPLHPFKFIHARTPADITDPENTIGIEVTDPTTAAQCRVNLDGQHGPGLATFDRWHGKAAVEIAVLEPPQSIYDPGQMSDPDYTTITLATSRPDLDSVAAMAVIVINAALGINFNAALDPYARINATAEQRDRVRMIAEADAFVAPAEWEPTPLPTEETPWPRAGSVDSRPELAYLAAICSPRRGDTEYPIAERVAIVATWLLYGVGVSQINAHFREVHAIYEACGILPEQWDADNSYSEWAADRTLRRLHDAYYNTLKARRELARWLSLPGSLKIACRECGTEQGPLNLERGNCGMCGNVHAHNVAVVRVAHAGAIGLGYCVAPVVVAVDAANPGKVTIACYGARYLDAEGLLADLREREAGWGGNVRSGIIGSPQNGGTKLTDNDIVKIVAAHLK